MTCGGTRRLIRRAFVEPVLPSPAVVRMWRHLRNCDDCRGHYNRVFELERVLTTGAIQRPCTRERRLSEPLALPPMRPRLYEVTPWLRFAPAIGAVAAILLAVFVVSDRGEVWLRRAAGAQALTVRVFCATTDLGGERLILPVSRDPGPDETTGCTTAGTLLFAYTSDAAGVLYVGLEAPDGASRWLTPVDVPLPLNHTAASTPLGLKLSGGALHRPLIELLFVRAPAPLSEDALERHDDEDLVVVRRRVPIEDVAQ